MNVLVVVGKFTQRDQRERGGGLRVKLRVTEVKQVSGPHYGGQKEGGEKHRMQPPNRVV